MGMFNRSLVLRFSLTLALGLTEFVAHAEGYAPLEKTTYRSIQDGPEQTNLFLSAKSALKKGDDKEGLAKLEQYVKSNASGQFSDEAWLILSQRAFAKNDFEKANELAAKVIEMNPPSRLHGQALFLKAKTSASLDQRSKALDLLGKIRTNEIDPEIRAELFTFWAKVASEDGKWLESVLALVKAQHEVSDPAERKVIVTKIEDQVATRLKENELNFILNEYPLAFPMPVVAMRLATVKLGQGQVDQAQKLLRDVVSKEPENSIYRKRASNQLDRMQHLDEVNLKKVGLLVPTTGRQESLGKAVQAGLELALADSISKGKVEVVTADAGDSVDTARAAFERLVFEERVSAIVGPLSGDQADVIASKSADLGIPNISLSPRRGLTERGAQIFRIGLTPERQVRALVSYAMERANAKNFAILFPEDAFGREFATEYFRIVRELGGEITAAESYEPAQTDFHIETENMIGKSFAHFRRQEGEDNLKKLEEKLGRKPNKRESELAANPPIVDFDVLFLPDTFRALGQIVPALAAADILSVQLMGPATWNNTQLLDRAGQYLEKGIFVDSYASARQSPVTKNFIDQYQVKQGNLPGSMSAFGYDVGLALKSAFAADRPLSGRDELRSRLEILGDLDGASGLYQWSSSREPLSELQLFQVRRGSFQHLGGILLKQRAQ